MNLEIKHLWSHKCPKKWDQYTLIVFVITLVIMLLIGTVVTVYLVKKNIKSDNIGLVNNEVEKNNNKYKVSKGTGKNLVGKYVKYDDNMYVILYDDETNGLQIISKDILKNKFYLGSSDTSIDWTSNTVKAETDLNNNDSLSNFELSIYSYNHAVNTLNAACSNLIKENSNIIGVRCVGSDPIKPYSENTKMNNFTYIEKKAEVDTIGMAYDTDTNYESDYNKMVALGINNAGDIYWLASRYVYIIGNETHFSIRRVHRDERFSRFCWFMWSRWKRYICIFFLWWWT